MTDRIRENSGNSTLKTHPKSASWLPYLVLVSVVVLSSIPNGLIVEALWNVSPGESCTVEGFMKNGYQRLSYHEDKNKIGTDDHFRCCVTINCPKGTVATLCSKDDPASTGCSECKPGTYQPFPFDSIYWDNVHCDSHTVCARGSRVLSAGNSTTNTVCECDLELGYYGKWPHCYKDKTCPVGHQLLLNGSCGLCPPNFYRASVSIQRCVPCSVCDKANQNIGRSCSTTEDTLCSNVTIAKSTGGVDGQLTLIVLVIVAILAIAALVPLALFCYKRTNKAKTSIRTDSPSSALTISDVVYQEGEILLPTEKLIFVEHRTDIKNIEHKDVLPDITSLLQVNRDTESQPAVSIVNLVEESDDVSYEVEEECNEQHRAEQMPIANVAMNGKTNVYGDYIVVINIKDKTALDT